MLKKVLRGFSGKRLVVGLSVALLGMQSVAAPVLAADNVQLRMPKNIKRRVPTNIKADYTPDLLLVMPNASAESDELDQALKDAKGTLVGTIGEGRLKVLVYKTEKGKLEETEKKFLKDKEHFNCVSRNYRFKAQIIVPNDPQFTQQWHLGAVNAPKAWDVTMGSGTKVAIFDSGCQASVPDLNGKTEKGYNAWTPEAHFLAGLAIAGGGGLLGDLLGAIGGATSGGAQTDVQGHGTVVATTACATANNSINVAGVAPKSKVYPVQIAGEGGFTDDLALIAGLMNMLSSGNRIVNISYGAPPPVGFTNAALHAPLHMFFNEYFLKGGLIFISSGNDGMFDPNPPVPYLNVVSAIDNTMTLTDFSNYGLSTTFTAPGKGIKCTARDGSVADVDGTSFSSPIVAGIAALVWSANPVLPNVAVQSILKASCFKAGAAPWTPYYGFGMPDANKAVKMAKGLNPF